MMKLSTMKKVVDTVDHEWRSPLAEWILSRWGFDEGSVYYYRSSANFVFIFKKNGVTHYLRFNDSCERDLLSIKSEIEVLLFLQTKAKNIVKPVKSFDQKYIEVIETEIGTFNAVVFEALPGKQLEIEELTQNQYYAWGKALGQLHQNLKGIPEDLKSKRHHWLEHLRQVQEQLPQEETEAKIELKQVMNWAKGLKVSDHHFGLIHFDFELDNLRWGNESIGILDFDDCSINCFVADIAFALGDLMSESLNLEHPLFKEFTKGYMTEMEIDQTLLREYHMFMRMHNIVTFAKLLRSVDVVILDTHPEWMRELYSKLLNKIECYRFSFNRKIVMD